MSNMTRSIFKRRMVLNVVGGQNRLSKRPKKSYVMRKTWTPGIVKIAGQRFCFYGFEQQQSHERSVAKTAGGAVLGSFVAPVVGTIIGGAIGARKKDTSRATLVFAPEDKPSDQFSVVVECDSYLHGRLSRLPVASLPAE